MEYLNGKDKVLFEEICEHLTKKDDDGKQRGARKVLALRCEYNTRISGFTIVIVVLAVMDIITTSHVESGLALNDSAGYLAFLSECSHSCGGGIQYLNPICDNISSTPCDENKTEIRPCNTHPCPGEGYSESNNRLDHWTCLSECSHSCGGGIQYLKRTCDITSSMPCNGSDSEIQPCNRDPCPVHGAWESWVSITECPRYCGGGTRYRVRKCNNPSPAFGGTTCYGNDTSIEQCPVNGGWDNWGSYSSCSRTCGGGSQTRFRNCNNPHPAFGGDICSGNRSETQFCNTYPCPVHGGWSSWSSITPCSKSCGDGYEFFIRRCNTPQPAYGGIWCSGVDYKSSKCNTQSCPGPSYDLSISHNTMSEDMKEWIVSNAKQALQTHGLSNKAATEMRDKLQDKYEGHWNCLIGSRSLHFRIWYWYDHYINFRLGNVEIVVYESHS